jgi:hypothetical protein
VKSEIRIILPSKFLHRTGGSKTLEFEGLRYTGFSTFFSRLR